MASFNHHRTDPSFGEGNQPAQQYTGAAFRRSNNPSGRKSWGGESATRGWEEPPSFIKRTMLVSSPRAHVKDQAPSSRNVRAFGNPGVSPSAAPPDQLANLKKQWNVQRDIPSGTVRNNPFVPKPEPANVPSPQLVHQKKQWDTSGIPRGAVAARAMSMEGEGGHPASIVIQSPNAGSHHQEKEPKLHSKNRRSFPITSSTTGAASSRGRLIENPLLSPSSAKQSLRQRRTQKDTFLGTPEKVQWEPTREISNSKGAVKGGMTSLPEKSGLETTDGFASWKNRDTADDSDEDPWIIPSQLSASSQVFSGDWGEAVAVKSSESDDWETPAKDWFRSSESQTTASKSAEEEGWKSKNKFLTTKAFSKSREGPAAIYEGPPGHTSVPEVIEETKLNEEEHFPDRRGHGLLSTSTEDLANTVYSREADILRSAMEKSRFSGVEKTPDFLLEDNVVRHDQKPLIHPAPRALAPPTKDVMAYNRKRASGSLRRRSNGSSAEVDVFGIESFPSRPALNDDLAGDVKETFRSSEDLRDEEPLKNRSDVRNSILPLSQGQQENFHGFDNFAEDGALSFDEEVSGVSQDSTPASSQSSEGIIHLKSSHQTHQNAANARLGNSGTSNNDRDKAKRQRKGFFKFFGGGKKDKDPQARHKKEKPPIISPTSRRSGVKNSGRNFKVDPTLKESSRVANWNPQDELKPHNPQDELKPHNEKKGTFVAETDKRIHKDQSSENHPESWKSNSSSAQICKKKSEDDTTISDMTLPTVFQSFGRQAKSSKSPVASRDTLTSPPLLPTPNFPPEGLVASQIISQGPHTTTAMPVGAGTPSLEPLSGQQDLRELQTSARQQKQNSLSATKLDDAQDLHVDRGSVGGVPSDKADNERETADYEDPALDHMNMDDDSEDDDMKLAEEYLGEAHQTIFDDTEEEKRCVNSSSAPPLVVMRKRKKDRLRKFEEVAGRNRQMATERKSPEIPANFPSPPSISQTESKTANSLSVTPRRSRRGMTSISQKPAQSETGKSDLLSASQDCIEASLSDARNNGIIRNQPESTATRTNNVDKFPKARKAYHRSGYRTAASDGHNNAKALSTSEERAGLKTATGYSSSSERIQSVQSSGAHLLKQHDSQMGKADGSFRSQRTADTSSVSSDIRVLRSILRRPRRVPTLDKPPRPEPVYASYNEKNITDPMQRAGLRLLSAAIIPIQTEVRRFLAMRRALTRMWALIVIQTYTRRWIACGAYMREIKSITTVQALCRGRADREELVYDHICAIEIQRFVRGYLATMRVYEDIYKITIVQSYVRMKLAVEKATHRMALVIQLQSVVRSFLVRRRLEYQRACATAIQANWRCFFTRLTYQFDLLDIIIVQSIWKRKVAARYVEHLRQKRKERCATYILQNSWRRELAVRHVEHLRQKRNERCAAHVLQNAWRREMAVRHVEHLRQKRNERCAAHVLQSAWKREMAVRHVEHLRQKRNERCAAHVLQSAWRREMAVRHVEHLRQKRNERHATRILQSAWRREMAVRHVEQLRQKRNERCATVIQSKWRSYDCTMNYLHYLADVLVAQSAVRRFLSNQYVASLKNEAAGRLQSVVRGFLQRRKLQRYCAARKMQSAWRGFVCYADYMFSIADIVVVQKLVRRWLSQRRAKELRSAQERRAKELRSAQERRAKELRSAQETESAKTVQNAWRKFLYSRRIQRAWRRHLLLQHRQHAAITIQKFWRCFVDETEYVVMKYEFYAARTIQCYWRRFWCFSNFIIALDCSIQIQTVFRGYLQRRRFSTMYQAVLAVQSASRAYLSRQEAQRSSIVTALVLVSDKGSENEAVAAKCIQRIFRGSLARNAVILYTSARRIQNLVRGRQARTAVGLYLCARAIQTLWRGFIPRRVFMTFIAARRIQCFWRYKRMKNAYTFYRAALAIQTRFRAVKARQEVLLIRGEYLAATLIQSAWRGFVCYTDYIFTVSDIISAQKIARGHLARKKYSFQIKYNCHRRVLELSSVVRIQKLCRGFMARQHYWYILGCTMQIQSWVRGRLVVLRLRRQENARLVLQSFARRCLGRQEYLQRKFIFMLIQTADKERTIRVAAMVIQAQCRSYLEQRKREKAACIIQRFFLMVKHEVDLMIRATKRRRNWRRKMKNRDERVEDALLEDAWLNTLSHSNLENEPLLSQLSNILSPPSQESDLVGSLSGSRGTSNKIQQRPRSQSRHTSKNRIGNSKSRTGKKHVLPPGYSDKPSTIVRLHHDDDQSEFSGLTASTAIFFRLPPSERRKLGSKEMEEDLELEEAFIDAEIFSAKERRLADNRNLQLPSSPSAPRIRSGDVLR